MNSFASLLKPVPDKDAQWIAWCPVCQDMELYASRGGFKNNGVQHCYGCGTETPMRGFKETDISRMKVSSWCHWQKFPLIPYNWHLLSEEQKFVVLGMRFKTSLIS